MRITETILKVGHDGAYDSAQFDRIRKEASHKGMRYTEGELENALKTLCKSFSYVKPEVNDDKSYDYKTFANVKGLEVEMHVSDKYERNSRVQPGYHKTLDLTRN